MKKPYLRILLILFILAGCSADNIVESFFEFPAQIWKRFENPIFEMDINKPGTLYNMFLVVDYDVYVAPEALPLTVIMSTPSGEVRSRTHRLIFAENKGEKGKFRILLRKNFAFAEKGICSFEIENRSQRIETPGLIRIGVVLEKAD